MLRLMLIGLIAFIVPATELQSRDMSAKPMADTNLYTVRLKDMNGNTKTLGEYIKGKPTVVSFWATWCPPCIAELKELNRLYAEYHKKGVQIVAVSIDNSRSVSKVSSTIKKYNYTFPVLLDTKSRFFKKMNGKHIPYTLVVDKKGKITDTYTGYSPADKKKLEALMKKLSKKSRSRRMLSF